MSSFQVVSWNMASTRRTIMALPLPPSRQWSSRAKYAFSIYTSIPYHCFVKVKPVRSLETWNLFIFSLNRYSGAKLKPFFVFVTPPPQAENLHRLLTLKNGQNVNESGISYADYQMILDEANEIESKYGHYFDMVLPMTDIERAYQELRNEITALESEPQWIPSAWIK